MKGKVCAMFEIRNQKFWNQKHSLDPICKFLCTEHASFLLQHKNFCWFGLGRPRAKKCQSIRHVNYAVHVLIYYSVCPHSFYWPTGLFFFFLFQHQLAHCSQAAVRDLDLCHHVSSLVVKLPVLFLCVLAGHFCYKIELMLLLYMVKSSCVNL